MKQPWFSEAKLGIFIHYGLYAVKGIHESWSIYKGEISYEDYMQQCEDFTASQYDPEAWAELFAEAGARYAVLTTKHHDGMALWDTDASHLNVVEQTPAGRDLVKPYCEALRKQGIKVGLYFSHLDWSHPDFATMLAPPPNTPPVEERNALADPLREEDVSQERWENFLRFHRAQLKELCERFDPELFWFDGHWGRSKEQWRMAELREQLHTWAPGVVLNSRMCGYGDYETPEQGIPITRPDGDWEFCMTINDSWGYQHQDNNYKSLERLVEIFCECLSMGGNLLLNVGPREDGTIPEPQVERLKGLGAWIRRHEEAVYSTQAGLPQGHYHGASSLSRDRKTLYLYLPGDPRGEIMVKGIHNPILSARTLGTGASLQYEVNGGAPWIDIPGITYIHVPSEVLDEVVTVVALEFEEPLQIYQGSGQAIEAN